MAYEHSEPAELVGGIFWLPDCEDEPEECTPEEHGTCGDLDQEIFDNSWFNR